MTITSENALPTSVYNSCDALSYDLIHIKIISIRFHSDYNPVRISKDILVIFGMNSGSFSSTQILKNQHFQILLYFPHQIKTYVN